MFVRVKAAVSLGRIGYAEALGALKRALKDKDENVRKAAKMAIEDIRLWASS